VAGDAEIERQLALALEVGLDEIRVVGRRKEKPVVKVTNSSLSMAVHDWSFYFMCASIAQKHIDSTCRLESCFSIGCDCNARFTRRKRILTAHAA
jgi:hypothetical protein